MHFHLSDLLHSLVSNDDDDDDDGYYPLRKEYPKIAVVEVVVEVVGDIILDLNDGSGGNGGNELNGLKNWNEEYVLRMLKLNR